MTSGSSRSALVADTVNPLPAAQQPDWPDSAVLRRVADELAGYPPLVRPEECDALRRHLAAAAVGRAFVLQGGDCAETFTGSTVADVEAKLRTMLQMAEILTYATSVPVIKIGRIAGQ